MNVNKRRKNEREFDAWEEIETGGRKYWFEIKGKSGGLARYIKIVDSDENTVSFVQEIYDATGALIEVHEKYPIDKGHKKLSDDNKATNS